MTRREIRDSAFKIIYEKLLRDDSLEDLYEMAEEVEEITLNEKVKEIVEGVTEHSYELDDIISNFSKTRGFSRIAKINIAILRIAVYEILYDDKTPVNAAINEAVLLSETYSFKEDTSFVNGILSAFEKTLPKLEETPEHA